MLRSSTRCLLLSFETVLHGRRGAADFLDEASTSFVPLQRAMDAFKNVSPSSAAPPLPVPMAAAQTAQLMKDGKIKDVAAVLGSHHLGGEVAEELGRYMNAHRSQYTFTNLKNLSDTLHAGRIPGSLQLLTLMADYSSGADGTEAQTYNSETRRCIMRHIRCKPSSAFHLLPSLCRVSTASKADRDDLMEVVNTAKRAGSLNPMHLGAVLDVLIQAKDYRKVAASWSWMQFTSACWCQEAASAAIIALCHLKRMDEAVACVQSLAEVNTDPTCAAQIAFVRLLATRQPPLPQYADQVAAHWVTGNAGKSLWLGETQQIGLLLIHAHFNAATTVSSSGSSRDDESNNSNSVLELLHEAAQALSGNQQESLNFVTTPIIAEVIIHLSKEIGSSRLLQSFFFNAISDASLDNSTSPHVLSAYMHLGWRLHRLSDVFEVFSRSSISEGQFAQAANHFADFQLQALSHPQEVLQAIQDMATHCQAEVPPKLSAWLQLSAQTSI